MAILIAFYSRAGENYFGGTYRRVAAGNTEKAAEMFSRLTGHVIKDMKALCPGADAVCEMQVKFDSNGGDRLETPESKIEAWAQSVKALL